MEVTDIAGYVRHNQLRCIFILTCILTICQKYVYSQPYNVRKLKMISEYKFLELLCIMVFSESFMHKLNKSNARRNDQSLSASPKHV